MDDYILGTAAVDEVIAEKIKRLHKLTRHKYKPIPTFKPVYAFTEEDYAKIQRGQRAKCNFVEDCATGGIVNPANCVSLTGIDPVTPDPESWFTLSPSTMKLMENALATCDKINDKLDAILARQEAENGIRN